MIDVKSLRNSLGMTQFDFCETYCINIDTLQNWEQLRCKPDHGSLLLLRLIQDDPIAIANAIHKLKSA